MALTDATRLANFGSGIGTDSTLDILNVNATGIVTAATLKVGSAVTVSGGIITATTGAFSGDVSVRNLTGVAATFTGVLTYDDVTNVDSVGIITARSDVSIADKIIHTGDTNTAIRFPAADTFTVETSGSEALRVNSDQKLLVGSTSSRDNFFDSSHSSNIQVEGNTTTKSSLAVIRNDNGSDGSRIFFAKSRGTGDTIVQDDDRIGAIEFQGNDGGGFVAAAHIAAFVDGTPGANDMPSRLVVSTTADGAASPTERLRIDSSGNVGINCTSGGGKLAILANASTYEGLELQTPSGDGSGEFHIGVHQTGTTSGRSIVVKRGGADGMDTESLRIDANGRVTVGGTSASASGPQYSRLQVLGNSFAETTGLFSLRRNEVFGDITAGEDLGVIHFADRTGNTFAEIHGECDGTTGSGDYPGRLSFHTTSDGASSTTERLRITSTGGFHFTNGELIERAKVTAGKLSDNTNIDLENGMVHLFTTQETTTSTPNIRINSSTSLNSVMATGEMISVTLITTAAAGAYSAQLTIDGGAVTENWTGGSAPSGGGSSGVDIHAYTIIKTADATFTVVATQTKTS